MDTSQYHSGHTYRAVLKRMQNSWYRVIDFTFITFAMFHGLNDIWNIFRDFKKKPWLKLSVISGLFLSGIAFTAWGYSIIFSILYLTEVAGTN